MVMWYERLRDGADQVLQYSLQNSQSLGDRKCLGKLRKSFVGHSDAILFLRISRERVFQHPQAFTLKTPLRRKQHD
jgi:hypothetical protein